MQRLRKLLRRRSARDAERVFVIEGTLGVAAALDAGAGVEALFVAPGVDALLVERAHAEGARVFELAPGVMERVADTVSPQPVAAVVRFLDLQLDALQDASFVLVCADVRDPGNAGTVLRSAEAAGAEAVVCAGGSVDLYNPKTVRASAGSLFHVPVVAGGDPVSIVKQLRDWGMTAIGAAAHGGADPADVDFTRRVALVLGNESHGIPADVDETLAERVTIPLAGRAESLNVGMAAAVLGFEVARQRRRSLS